MAKPSRLEAALPLLGALALVLLMYVKRAGPPPSKAYPGPSEAAKVNSIQETLEPLSRDVLVRRSLDTFPDGYLNHISIIQGVALGLLIQQAFSVLTSEKYSTYRVGIFGEAFLLFLGIVIVSYGYIWFLTIMRWTPRFWDTLVPLTLGVTEIIPIFLLASFRWWLVFMAIFATMGALAFKHSLSNLTHALFPNDYQTYTLVRTLLRRLVGICLLMALICGVSLIISQPRTWFVNTLPWGLIIVIPVLVVMNEKTLDQIYLNFGVRR
ncbi:hypothetical protein ACWED2_04810 [Amycolatopsis sp. NPDC005003]